MPSKLGTKVGRHSLHSVITLDCAVPGAEWHAVFLVASVAGSPSPRRRASHSLCAACPAGLLLSECPHHPTLGPFPLLAALSLGYGDQAAPSHGSAWSSSPVPYDICRPDHSVLTLQLPVTASVREVMAALAQEDGWTKGQVLVKVNSAGGKLCLWVGVPHRRGPPRAMPGAPKRRS